MPEYPVELSNPPASLVVKLNKVPKVGSWFPLGDGTEARAKAVRVIGGERVIYASGRRDIAKPS